MPNIREIEILRQNLLLELTANTSPRFSIKRLNIFFSLLFESNEPSLVEAYSLEFSDIYLRNWKEFDPVGISPSFSWELVEKCKELLERGLFQNLQKKLEEYIYMVEDKIISMEMILGGKSDSSVSKGQAAFPVLETNPENEFSFRLFRKREYYYQ